MTTTAEHLSGAVGVLVAAHDQDKHKLRRQAERHRRILAACPYPLHPGTPDSDAYDRYRDEILEAEANDLG